MLLPHEILHALHARGRLEDLFIGKCDLEKFWASVRNTEWFKDHPVLQKDLKNAIPIGIHGDDAGVGKRSKITALVFSSILLRTSTWNSRFLSAVLPYCRIVPGTLTKLFEVMTWSLQACYAGIFPESDHLGQRWGEGKEDKRRKLKSGTCIAGGKFFVVIDIRGDWK